MVSLFLFLTFLRNGQQERFRIHASLEERKKRKKKEILISALLP